MIDAPSSPIAAGSPGQHSDPPGARIVALYRYPLKAFSPERLDRVKLAAGATLPFDRAYAIENGPGRFDPEAPRHLPKVTFLTLMRDERIATLDTAFDDATETLTIFRGGKQVARGQLSTRLGRQMIEQFLAAYLRAGLRGPPRVVSAPGHSFSDVAAKCVHIVNLASVRDLERLAGRVHVAVPRGERAVAACRGLRRGCPRRCVLCDEVRPPGALEMPRDVLREARTDRRDLVVGAEVHGRRHERVELVLSADLGVGTQFEVVDMDADIKALMAKPEHTEPAIQVQHILISPSVAYFFLVIGLSLIVFEFFAASIGFGALVGALMVRSL